MSYDAFYSSSPPHYYPPVLRSSWSTTPRSTTPPSSAKRPIGKPQSSHTRSNSSTFASSTCIYDSLGRKEPTLRRPFSYCSSFPEKHQHQKQQHHYREHDRKKQYLYQHDQEQDYNNLTKEAPAMFTSRPAVYRQPIESAARQRQRRASFSSSSSSSSSSVSSQQRNHRPPNQKQQKQLMQPMNVVTDYHRLNRTSSSSKRQVQKTKLKPIENRNNTPPSTEQLRVKRKPLVQPIVTPADMHFPLNTSFSNHHQKIIQHQQPIRQVYPSRHQQQHKQQPQQQHVTKWKVSGQYDHLLLRSPLSPAPSSLFDGSSATFTTAASSLDSSQQHSASMLDSNGLIYHRKPTRNVLKVGNSAGFQQDAMVGSEQMVLAATAPTAASAMATKTTVPATTVATTVLPPPASTSSVPSTSSTVSSASSSSPGSTHASTNVTSTLSSQYHNDYHQQQHPSKPSSKSSISTYSRHSRENQYRDRDASNHSTERPRRHSQGEYSSRMSSSEHQIPNRVSTPKLRRVMSAKPCVKSLPSQASMKITTDEEILEDATTDAASLVLAKRKLATKLPTLEEKQHQQQQQQQQHKTRRKEEAELRRHAPSFWNPRSENDIIPVKRTLSRCLRGLLLPQRSKLDNTVSKDHNLAADHQWSITRPMTPVNEISFDNDALLEDQENGIVTNPFYIISQSWSVADQTGLLFDKDDFVQMDAYAASVQQTGPCLTPQILSQKFLVRPYRRDLYRLRIIYIWIVQNINILDQRLASGQQQDGTNDSADDSGNTNHPELMATSQPAKTIFRQLLTTRRHNQTHDTEEELETPVLDVMDGDGLLPEGGADVESFDDWLYSESSEQVLLRRTCSSSIGMANLFCEMAMAAGIRDVRVVYGYLRAPKDSLTTACMDVSEITEDNATLVQNHAWCCVKVEGEYRFVDCWLASPFQPQNKGKIEHHWFLTKPSHMIYTHFPQESADQCLEPVIDAITFFALPYVWAPFFSHHIKMIRYNPDSILLLDDQVCHLIFRVDPDIVCFAFVETDRRATKQESSSTLSSSSTTMRCLAQSRMIPTEDGKVERVYKIKAVLPPDHEHGWLKIYAGHSTTTTSSSHANNICLSSSSSSSTRQDNGSNGSSLLSSRHILASNATNANSLMSPIELPPLALCFRLTSSSSSSSPDQQNDRRRSFEFVHLHQCRYEFYIQEPQCYQLFPLQTYNFLIRGGDTHHKLAIRSPSGKLYKLMSYPQEHSYDGSVKISETGKWSLICLLHHAGGWYVVATWECRG